MVTRGTKKSLIDTSRNKDAKLCFKPYQKKCSSSILVGSKPPKSGILSTTKFVDVCTEIAINELFKSVNCHELFCVAVTLQYHDYHLILFNTLSRVTGFCYLRLKSLSRSGFFKFVKQGSIMRKKVAFFSLKC